MPRENDTSNSQMNRTDSTQEGGSWQSNRASDQAARIPALVNMPPLVSQARQRIRSLGGSASRLARWVTGHGGLVSTVSQAAHWPVLSRAFDFIRGKTIVDSPVWQRTLDLPWFPGRLPRRKQPAPKTRGVFGRKQDIDMQPDEPYRDVPQIDGDAGRVPTEHEIAETYPPAADSTYPLINAELLTPPPSVRKALQPRGDAPLTRGDTSLPRQSEKKPEKRYLKEAGKPLPLVAREETGQPPAGKVYPEITKDLPSPPDIGKRAPDTAIERPHDVRDSSSGIPPDSRQIMESAEVESGAEVLMPDAEESRGKDIRKERTDQIARAGTKPPRPVEGKSGERIQQSRRTYLSQKLSRVLKPITQRIPFIHPPLEIARPIAGERTTASQSSDAIDTGAPDRPTVPVVQAFHPPETVREALKLKPGSVPPAPSVGKESPLSRDVIKMTGSSIKSGKSEYSAGREAEAIAPETLASPEDFETPSGLVSPPLVPKPGQARRQKPPFGSSVPFPVQRAGAPAGDTADDIEGMGDFGLVSPEFTDTRRNLLGGRIYRSLISRSSSSGKEYARRQELDLPVVTPVGQGARTGGQPGEELLANMYSTVPELTASPEFTVSRYASTPELALAPLGGPQAVISSQVAGVKTPIAEGIEPEKESTTAPDIDAIAHNVYKILKRRLMAERERALGVY